MVCRIKNFNWLALELLLYITNERDTLRQTQREREREREIYTGTETKTGNI